MKREKKNWVKCVDCKYNSKSDFNSSKVDCNLPLSYNRHDEQIDYDFAKSEFIACVWGKNLKLNIQRE